MVYKDYIDELLSKPQMRDVIPEHIRGNTSKKLMGIEYLASIVDSIEERKLLILSLNEMAVLLN